MLDSFGMNPLEAYHTLMRFAQRRGEAAVQLASYAAVPQSFRADLLHLLRVNFMPEGAHDSAVEADVLLAPFCEDIGGGYFQFDAEARKLLLEHLAAADTHEKRGTRVQRVARFLLAYIEQSSRTFREYQDQVAREYLEIQRWVALAFLDPAAAAEQLAAALAHATSQSDPLVRVQLGGLVSGLTIPLVKYPQLLTYAAGVQAVEEGQAEQGRDLLARLPDEGVAVGRVKLRSPHQVFGNRRGENTSRKTKGDEGERRIELQREIRNSIGMELILIPAGEFLMGSENGLDSEKPVRRVQISQPFYIGKYPVTQAQWQVVMKGNPSSFTEDLNRPVERVSWNDAQEFLRKLSALERGKSYRLPTEAEWEYAARAGSTGEYCFGNDVKLLPEYAWYSENSGDSTHPVGQLKSNAWGLCDVHGNVWEWVQDWYAEDYYQQRPNPDRDPQGPGRGQYRSLRGGSWGTLPQYARASDRGGSEPGARGDDVGFRCAQQLDSSGF